MAKTKKDFKKHMMYSKSGEGKMANTYEEHLALKKSKFSRHTKPKKGISRLVRGKLGKTPKYFIGSLIQGISGKKKTKAQLKDAEAEYANLQAKEEALKKDRQQLTMSPEAMKLKEGMAGTQVQQEQENIDTKMATATAAATRGGSRVSAFEASGAADDAQRDLSSRRESAKRSGMKNAMDERGKLRQAQEARQQADQARQAQLTDYGREDIQNLQANQAAYETQMYGSIDAGIGTVASMSDRKEKKNIKKLGKTKSGVPVSEFEYKDKKNAPQGSGKYKGVIAQDLVGTKHGDAVKKIGKNTLGVNYGKLDIKLGKIGGGKLKDKVKKKYNKGGAPKKDFMEGGDADVTPGKFSHEENPIDLVQNNEEGNREKIGEMTGGEAIVPPKNVTQIRQMISNSDGKALVNLMDKLLTKWDKEAQENTEAREVFRKTKKAKRGSVIRPRIPMGKDWGKRRTRNSIFD